MVRQSRSTAGLAGVRSLLQRSLLIASVVFTVAGNAVVASAAPARIFVPHLKEIRANLPPGWTMRLPAQILLSDPADEELINQLIVKVLPSNSPPGLTIGLFTCQASHHPCLVGSLAVDSQDSPNAQRELKRHQAAAAPIKLGEGVRGYLLEGRFKKPTNSFSSVMWQQDGMIYTVSFLAVERQNLLLMAYSMANENPYLSLAVRR